VSPKCRRTARMPGGPFPPAKRPERNRSSRRPDLKTQLRRRTARMPGGPASSAKRPARNRSSRRRAITLYASRAEEPLTHLMRRFVKQMRRRTARMPGGRASYSQTPGARPESQASYINFFKERQEVFLLQVGANLPSHFSCTQSTCCIFWHFQRT
jgi:3-phenylpropionate/cinnamic acid dioxygenase small subunit